MKDFKISLIVPVYNEEHTLMHLIGDISSQTFKPFETVFVDGGSTDRTVELIEKLSQTNPGLKVVRAGRATPGRGRNIGSEIALSEWIAFTDAGIRLKEDWLEKLARTAAGNPSADIVYGNYAPVIENFFEKCAALAYVPAQAGERIRGKFVASTLMKKKVWQEVGGFPDLRAAEDLMFMEAAEKQGFRAADAPDAQIYWHLRPDLASTFRKFVLYSKHNVEAGRQWDWHYGVVKQYVLLAPFLILAILHSPWWLTATPLWLAARAAKRILPHRFELGWATVFNPLIFLGVMFLILIIDAATFTGWIKAILNADARE